MTDSPEPAAAAPRPIRLRVADVQLRGPAPRRRARVYWPAAGARAAALVVLLTDPAVPPSAVESLVERLAGRVDAVVLAVSAGHVVEAHAAVSWAADHAAELGAEPGRLGLLGAGAGAEQARRVAELARDDGWPPLRHVAAIRSHALPDAASDAVLDGLAAALAGARPGRSA